MKCPHCQSEHYSKNGHKRGKQNHLCLDCGRQFVENPNPYRGYSDDIRRSCQKMFVSGMSFRAIERTTGIHHSTVISWVKQFGEFKTPKTTPHAKDREKRQN